MFDIDYLGSIGYCNTVYQRSWDLARCVPHWVGVWPGGPRPFEFLAGWGVEWGDARPVAGIHFRRPSTEVGLPGSEKKTTYNNNG